MFKNFCYQLLYQMIDIVYPIIIIPVLTNKLGAKFLGVYEYNFAIISYFIILSNFGIETYGQRKISQTRDDSEKLNKAFNKILSVKLITTTLSLFVLTFLIYLDIFKYNFVLGIFSIQIIALYFDLSWFFRGIEDFKKISLRNVIMKITNLILLFTLIKSKEDVYFYIGMISITKLLLNLSYWQGISKYIKNVNLEITELSIYLKGCFYLFIPNVAKSIYLLTDKFMIGNMTLIEEVSYYSISKKMIILSLILTTSLSSIISPRISNYFFKKDFFMIKKVLKRLISINIIICFGTMFGILSTADNIVAIMLPKEFMEIGGAIKLFSIGTIFYTITSITSNQILIPSNNENKRTIAALLGMFINIILNVILIPKYGYKGAIIATLITEGVISVILLYYSKEYFHFKYTCFFKSLVSGIIMYLIIKDLEYLIIQLMLGVLVYIGTLILLREKNTIEELFRLKYLLINK